MVPVSVPTLRAPALSGFPPRHPFRMYCDWDT